MVSTSNVVISKDGVQVTIGTTRIVENGTKALTLITVPKSSDNQSIVDGANITQILDMLLKAERRYTINGEMITGLGSGDTSSDASDKRDDLREIFFAGGVFSVTIFGTTYQANADKYEFTWSADDEDTITHYGVTMTLVVGTNLGGS